MGKIHSGRVIWVLKEISEEYPDRTDPRSGTQQCRYIGNGRPQCLVAEVLSRLGVSTKSLSQLDRECRGQPVQLSGSKHPSVRRFTRSARDLLDFVQRVQDSGRTWGSTVAWATESNGRTRSWMTEAESMSHTRD